jgi:hypothetical protein
VRGQWMKWELQADDEEDTFIWCCGLQKEHLEAFIYWMIYCCFRKSSGRKDIRYRSYTPLSSISDSQHGSQHGGAEKRKDDVDDGSFRVGPADRVYSSGAWFSSGSWTTPLAWFTR